VIDSYPNAELVWVQDEPENQGAWPFIALEVVKHLHGRTIRRVSRAAAASTATGSPKVHAREQAAILEKALTSDSSGGGRSSHALSASRPSTMVPSASPSPARSRVARRASSAPSISSRGCAAGVGDVENDDAPGLVASDLDDVIRRGYFAALAPR
jgi:hypothetical protein